VVILGDGFSRHSEVRFGDVDAASVEFIDSHALVVTTPPGEVGVVDVSVVRRDGESALLDDGFQYTAASGRCHVIAERVVGAADDPADPRIAFTFDAAIEQDACVEATYETTAGVRAARVDCEVSGSTLIVRPRDAYGTARLVLSVDASTADGDCDPHAMLLPVASPTAVVANGPPRAHAARDVIRYDAYAIVAVAQARFLEVYSVTPSSVTGPVVTLALRAIPETLRRVGDDLFVGYGLAGIDRFRMSSGSSLAFERLASIGTNGRVTSLAAGPIGARDVLLVGDGTEGARLFDVTDARGAIPGAVVVARGSNPVTSVDLADSLAAFADGTRFGLVDLANPSDPALLVALPGKYTTVDLDGSRLYAGRGAYGLDIFDVSTPDSPDLLDTITGSHGECTVSCVDEFRQHVASGDRLFVAAVRGELLEYDMTDPTSVAFVGTRSVRRHAFGVAVDETRIFTTDDRGLVAFDLGAPPEEPAVFVPPGTGLDAQGLVVGSRVEGGSLVYVAASAGGVQTYLVDDETETPTLIDADATVASASPLLDVAAADVALTPEGLIVADERGGSIRFSLTDVRDPAFGEELGVLDRQSRVASSGSLVALCSDNEGILLASTATGSLELLHAIGFDELPASPVTQACHAVLFDGTRLYMGARGMVVAFDVTTPATPALLGAYAFGSGEPVVGLAMDEAWLVAASSTADPDALDREAIGRVHLLDVSVPSAMTAAFVSDDLGGLLDVIVHDERIYASTRSNGVAVLDATGTHAFLGTIPASGRLGSLAANGRTLYVAARSLGLVSVPLRVRF